MFEKLKQIVRDLNYVKELRAENDWLNRQYSMRGQTINELSAKLTKLKTRNSNYHKTLSKLKSKLRTLETCKSISNSNEESQIDQESSREETHDS